MIKKYIKLLCLCLSTILYSSDHLEISYLYSPFPKGSTTFNDSNSSTVSCEETDASCQEAEPKLKNIKKTSQELPYFIESIHTTLCFGSPKGANHTQNPSLEIYILLKENYSETKYNTECFFKNDQTCTLTISSKNNPEYSTEFSCNELLQLHDFLPSEKKPSHEIIRIECTRKTESKISLEKLSKLFPRKNKPYLTDSLTLHSDSDTNSDNNAEETPIFTDPHPKTFIDPYSLKYE